MTTEEVTYTRKRKTLPINTYTVGRAGKRKMLSTGLIERGFTHAEGLDFFDTLKEVSNDPAIHLISDLLSYKDSITNIAVLPVGLEQSDRNKQSKAYKHLNQLGLVTRVKRGHYLINPRFVPPYPEYYDSVCLHWIQLTGAQP